MADESDPRSAPAPAYVVTEADRDRWKVSGDIAEALWELHEDTPLDPTWYWQMQRSIYRQEIPTGPAALVESEEVDPDADVEAEHEHAWALWHQIEKDKPGQYAGDDEHWSHVAHICNLFDSLLGNPDHISLGQYESAIPLTEAEKHRDGVNDFLVAAGELDEAYGRVFHGAYAATLHPRDRLGKWAQKLNGVRAAALDRGSAIRQNVGLAVAARRLHHDVSKAHKPGGALHADPSRAFHHEATDAEKMAAHATQQRARQGLRGAKQQAAVKSEHAHAHALTSLAYVYSEDAAKKAGGFHESTKDATAALETADRAQHMSNLAHESARWVMEHHNEIRMVGHAVTHAARAVGIAAAEITDEDTADAAMILESLSA